jgi:hypothetical protein
MFQMNGRATACLRWGALVLLGVLLASPVSAQVLSGTLDGDLYGRSVAWAGDVNHDGYEDFLVGAPGANGPAGRAGMVELYLGRYGVYPTTPDAVYYGEVSGDEFGYAVSTAGDLDGDGYDDFLVGAPGNDESGVQAGKVYLFFGAGTPPSGPDLSWTGDLPGARFGAALAGGFNFNKDGYDDFAVGAPAITDTRPDGAGLRAGQVKVYLGSGNPSSIEASFTFYGDQARWDLGYALDPAGDVNKDGYDDLIAGAPQREDLNPGHAVIWLGQSSTATTPARVVLEGQTGADRFGSDVSGAGDQNGDGYDDVLVGAPGRDSAGIGSGTIYIFRGGFTVNTLSTWFANGQTAGDSLGTAVDGGFDMNGDGVPDLAAGAPGRDDPGANAGQVRIYYGGSSPDVSGDRLIAPMPPIPSYEASDRFGASVRFVGSFNGTASELDARAELLAGAPQGNAAQGIESGYVDFIVSPGGYTPVRVVSFTAAAAAGGVEIRWELAESDGLVGVRVERARDGRVTAVNDGWLAPSAGSVLDAEASAGRTEYRLVGLDRGGEASVLALTSYAGSLPHLAMGLPERNPFREALSFRVTLPAGPARVTVWDARGREVRRLYEGEGGGRTMDLTWDGRDAGGAQAPAGLYFVRATGGGEQAAFKVVRLP